jgi:pyruvate dehydrogenase E2 component (dihydrolipoamide acetyltransferase)
VAVSSNEPGPGSTREAPDLLEAVPLKGLRGIIAQRMLESLHTMAQLTFHREIDVRELVRLRDSINTQNQGGVTYNDMVLFAVAQLLPEHPILNATIDDDTVFRWKSINLGIAVALEDGLMVPVIRNAHSGDLNYLMSESRRLGSLARARTIRSHELLGSTFTVTNLGAYGVDAFTPIINPPEVAILGVGRIREEKKMTLSLTVDHRAVDGLPAARFLSGIAEALEHPETLRF